MDQEDLQKCIDEIQKNAKPEHFKPSHIAFLDEDVFFEFMESYIADPSKMPK